MLRILLLEDSEDDAVLLVHELKRAGYQTTSERVDTREGFEAALSDKTWDIITADYAMPSFNGLVALSVLQEKGLDIPFIIVSGQIGEELAVEAMRNGASDYILKSNLKRLVPTIEREVREAKNRCRQRQSEKLNRALNNISVAITSTLNFDEIMHTVVRESVNAIGCDTAAISVREGSEWVVKYIYGLPAVFIGRSFSMLQKPLGVYITKARQPIVISDIYNDPRVNDQLADEYGIRSCLMVPLFAREAIVGGIIFNYHSEPVDFTDLQIDFTHKLAASVSLALENAHLYEAEKEARRQAKYELEISTFLLKAADTLAMSIGVDEVLERLAEITLKATGLPRAFVNLIDMGRRELTLKVAMGGLKAPSAAVVSFNQLSETSVKAILAKKTAILDYELPQTPEYDRKIAQANDARLVLFVPLLLKGEIIGHISIDKPGERHKFSEREIKLVEGSAAQAAVIVENARLHEAEHLIAETLQEELLTLPQEIPGVDFGYLYRSATDRAKVGGDFYDVFDVGQGKVGFMIGDVSGKGVTAAGLTSLVKNTIRAYVFQGDMPAVAVEKTNNLVNKAISKATFVTVFFGVLDTMSGDMSCCSAGHPSPLVKQKTGVSNLQTVGSLPIGAFANQTYPQQRVTIHGDDILILYTDGITEARCGSEFFGEERLVELIGRLDHQSPRELTEAIFSETLNFTGGALADDVALLALSLSKGENHASIS